MASSVTTEDSRAIADGSDGGIISPASGGGPRGGGSPAMPAHVYMTGLLVALCGIGMFFVALVSAYVVREGLGQSDWRALHLPPVLWLNTAILLASSGTLFMARRRQTHDDAQGFRYWWRVTAALGALFLAGQLVAWAQMVRGGLYLSTSASAGFFYVFSAAHGMHLLGGLAILIGLAFRAPKRMSEATAARVTAVYWHFLSGLWVMLLLFLVFQR